MKRLVLFLFMLASLSSFAQNNTESDTLKNMLIITCHPDDWELSMAGTAYLLKDKFNIHVIIASDGERGNSKEPDPKIAALRVEHSTKSAERINAQNHFFKMMDGEVFADEEAVAKTVKLLEELDPAPHGKDVFYDSFVFHIFNGFKHSARICGDPTACPGR